MQIMIQLEEVQRERQQQKIKNKLNKKIKGQRRKVNQEGSCKQIQQMLLILLLLNIKLNFYLHRI